MVDVLDRQVELVFVPIVGAAELGAAVGQHALQRHVVFLEERDDAIIEQIGGGDRGLAAIELGEAELAVGIDEGLLVDASDALEGSDIERILRAAIAGAFGIELAVSFFVGLGFFQGGELAISPYPMQMLRRQLRIVRRG